MNSKKRLTALIIIFPLVALLLYGFLSYMFLFYNQNKNKKTEIIQYEQTLLDIHKSSLQEKVNSLAQFIHHYDNKSSDKIKEDVKSIVNIAVDVANSLTNTYKEKYNKKELQQLVVAALKNVNFENNLGYLFVLDTSGVVYIHKDAKLVGRNLINIKDINGKYIIKEFAKVATKNGEGFVDYYWYMPGESRKKLYYKISYIKKIDNLNWFIGAGEYLKFMKRYLQKDMLEYIANNSEFDGGYFFVSDSQNEIILSTKDSKIDKQKIEKYRIDGIYKDSKIIAFTKYIPEYDWYITAVKELKDIQKEIEAKKLINSEKLASNIKTNLFIMFITWLLSIALSLYLSTIINKMLKKYELQIKSTNEKLIFQSRQALLGELLPMIAHQWRQPINKIASVIALLRFDEKERKDEKKVDEYYKKIEDNVEFMSETIDDFRKFYQPKQIASIANLKELIEKSVDFLSDTMRKKDIKLKLDLENINHEVYINEFLQVMINIIKNATDELFEGGSIYIKLYKRKGLIIIDIEDNGKGIDKNIMCKIFEPYVSTKEGSMGLGLYMSKIIIEKHMHGVLRATNKPEGGACFSIIFKDSSKK